MPVAAATFRGAIPKRSVPPRLPDDLSWTVPRALTAAEIRDLIEQIAESASHLKACGFSGVEISAGHGHLFHQFLSPWSNRRTTNMAAIGKAARASSPNWW